MLHHPLLVCLVWLQKDTAVLQVEDMASFNVYILTTPRSALYLQGNPASPPTSCSLGSIHKAQSCKTHRTHTHFASNECPLKGCMWASFTIALKHIFNYLRLPSFSLDNFLAFVFQMLLIICYYSNNLVIQQFTPIFMDELPRAVCYHHSSRFISPRPPLRSSVWTLLRLGIL